MQLRLNFTGYSRISGNYIASQQTGAICCNTQTMNAIGMPPHQYQFVRSCCDTYTQSQANLRLAEIEAARAKALTRVR